MSDLTKGSSVGIGGQSGFKLTPLTRQAGVEIAAGDALYIDTAGLLQKAVSTVQLVTGTRAESSFDGLAAVKIPSGTFGEIYGRGSAFAYAASGLVIGSGVYVSNTAGKLADAKVATNDSPVAIVRSATDIELIRGV